MHFCGGTYNVALAGGFASGGIVDNKAHVIMLVFNGGGTNNSDRLKLIIDGVEQTLTFTSNVGTLTSAIITYVF